MGGYGTEAGDIAILLIKHDIGVVTDISDHIVVMGQGKKLTEGTHPRWCGEPLMWVVLKAEVLRISETGAGLRTYVVAFTDRPRMRALAVVRRAKVDVVAGAVRDDRW